jgi:hypothetical protein
MGITMPVSPHAGNRENIHPFSHSSHEQLIKAASQ